MGNINQNELCEQESSQLTDKNISKKGTVNIYQFGWVPLLKNQITNQYFFVHECQFISASDDKSWKSLQTLKRLNNVCPNLIHIWKIAPQKQVPNCSGKNKLLVYFQYLPISLKELIENRKSPFPQSQIHKIFNSLLVAIRHLNNKQSYHGDITPEFIYFDEGAIYKYKIFDPVYFSPNKSGYYRAQSQRVYCAPQILANLNQKRTFPLYNHYICDTYSIGLVILYCMTLIDPLVAYQNSKRQIDYYYIESLIRVALKNNYTDKLVKCLRQCLLVKNRPTVSQILQNYQFLNINFQSEELKFSLRKV